MIPPMRAIVAAAVALLVGQAPAKPAFDAASIKPSATPASAPSFIGPSGERVVARNVTLRQLIRFAYRNANGGVLLNGQMIDIPRWGESDVFDVQATAGAGVPVTDRLLRTMTQTLLEDRFQLRVHREMRELPVYDLIVGKGGLRMTPASDQTPPDDRGKYRVTARPSPSGAIAVTFSGVAIGVPALIGNVQQYLDRPLLDSTRLDGVYDVRLEFALPQQRSVDDDSGAASIFTAVQEQLGLKLDAVRKPIEVLVIDHADHPTAD